MEHLRTLYDRDDFKRIYRRIESDIIVRKYNNNLDDIPEFSNLPPTIKVYIKQMESACQFTYEMVCDHGLLYNTNYVVLIDKKEEKWIGWFQYNQPTGVAKIFELFSNISEGERNVIIVAGILKKIEDSRNTAK